MYQIRTSELLSGNAIIEELTNIVVVKGISDDLFETKHHYVYAAFCGKYKIEFSFEKTNGSCQYIMIEEYGSDRERQNINIEFIDDISILGQHIDSVRERFKDFNSKDNYIKVGNIELYYLDNEIESLYYLPNRSLITNDAAANK